MTKRRLEPASPDACELAPGLPPRQPPWRPLGHSIPRGLAAAPAQSQTSTGDGVDDTLFVMIKSTCSLEHLDADDESSETLQVGLKGFVFDEGWGT